VFADMMFGVSLIDPRDRAVVVSVTRRMLRRGRAGVLRVAKNLVRAVTRRGERPARTEWWRAALTDAGFVDVDVRALAHEGGIACARRPR
jgi:hypothetical protein